MFAFSIHSSLAFLLLYVHFLECRQRNARYELNPPSDIKRNFSVMQCAARAHADDVSMILMNGSDGCANLTGADSSFIASATLNMTRKATFTVFNPEVIIGLDMRKPDFDGHFIMERDTFGYIVV